MIANLINTSYSHTQTLSQWYWSRSTQTRIADTINETRDILSTILIVLSHAYSDGVALLDEWLTYGLNDIVITESDERECDWMDVRAMVQGDLAYAQTWLSFTLSDLSNVITEYWYRLRTLAR